MACTTLAVAGHVAAGRAAVAPKAVVLGFALLYLVAWALTGAERSLATILGGLLGGQFMLHALFAAAAPTVTTVRHTGGHALHQVVATSDVVPGASGATFGAGVVMLVAHVTAALGAAWWLRKGEQAVWTLARRVAVLAAYPLRALRTLVALLGAAPACCPAPVGRLRTNGLIRPASVALRGSVTRRGPPFGSTTFAWR
jgi:hypothetical protein